MSIGFPTVTELNSSKKKSEKSKHHHLSTTEVIKYIGQLSKITTFSFFDKQMNYLFTNMYCSIGLFLEYIRHET